MMGRHNRSAAVAGVLLVLATGLLVGCGGSATSGTAGASGSTSTTADLAPDFSGVILDGSGVSLSGYRGRPLVLAFMASW